MLPAKGASFTAPRSAVVALLSAASRVATNGKPIPVLGSIAVDVHDDVLTWWATDTRIWRGGSIDVEMATPGAGLLPVALALAALKQCADGPVALTLAARDTVVRASGYTVKLPVCPLDEFPVLPIAPVGGIEIPCAALARIIEQTYPAIWPEHSNYSIRGAHVVVDATGIQMTTHDGHRMARASAAATLHGERDVIIPCEALKELALMLADRDQAVTYLAVGEQHVFRVGSDVLVTRAIDSIFPSLDRVIPTSWTTRMVCARDGWVRALARVAVVVDVKNPTVVVDIADGQMTLTTHSVERGEAVESFAVETQGEPLTFKAKPGYLRDFLVSARTNAVACEAQNNKSPIALKSIGQDGGDYFYIVSPMVL